MKKLLFAALLSLPAFAQPTVIAPDCTITLNAQTATGTSAVYDNRPESAYPNVPCTEFILVAKASTSNVSFSVQMESAQDNGSAGCSTCSWSIFGTALTADATLVKKSAAADFVRIHLTAISGGNVSATLNGWRDNAASIGGGGGGGSSTFDACQTNSRSVTVLSLTSNTKIISGTSSKNTFICYLQFAISATADNVALVEGTGSTCGSSTTGMAGGSTAATGWNLLANGTVTAGGIQNWAFKTATTADDVCLLVSSGAQLSGVVQYVQQ